MKIRHTVPGVLLVAASLLAACTPAAEEAPTVEAAEVSEEPADAAAEEPAAAIPDADLSVVKDYAIDHGQQMQSHAAELEAQAAEYYDIIAAADFDYEAAWESDGERLAELMDQMRATWLDSSTHYELDEGIVAGVPQLADFDAWIDASPSAAEAPDEAYEWTLELPSGETLESPGNIYHYLLEPALYGTHADYVGAEVDLDGDGEVAFTEVLPEANILYGAAQALNHAGTEMVAAIEAWEPTTEDAFTALLVMTPTMSEYFEQWKQSAAVTGDATQEESFIAVSRLFDVNGILNGLDLTYDNLSGMVESADPTLDEQIQAGYEELTTYVGDLYEDEQGGRQFTPEEADALGTEAQDQAQALAALVAQAADETGVEVTLD